MKLRFSLEPCAHFGFATLRTRSEDPQVTIPDYLMGDRMATAIVHMQHRLEAAEELLEGFRKGGCFCQVGIGNPMFRDHTEHCRKVMSFLETKDA